METLKPWFPWLHQKQVFDAYFVKTCQKPYFNLCFYGQKVTYLKKKKKMYMYLIFIQKLNRYFTQNTLHIAKSIPGTSEM